MRPIDWILLAFPVAIVVAAALKARRYVHGVADFLSAGRTARRYLLCVASGEAGYGLVTLVGVMEAFYNSGFAYDFWREIMTPLAMALGLVGYCTYRFRETRAMTLGQFFEMRYNRAFRQTASGIQFLAGFVNYAIFPAVGARFMMYFMRLPVAFHAFGFQIPTFAALMALELALACFIACLGGQITIMVTDCIQGILNYPIYLLVVVCLLLRFSWWRDLLPALSARPEGMDFLNPFDTSGLRDFNMFYVFSGVLNLLFNRMIWGGTGYQSAARDAHEAKIGALLGTWRAGFSNMMIVLVAVVAYAWFGQQRVASAVRDILPHGLLGLFAALALFMMLTTDTTYIHGLAAVAVQDCILPLRGGLAPLGPRRQVRWLRLAICAVAAGAFLFSLLFGQIDFVLMFMSVTGAIVSAAGPVLIFGLYWRRGTIQGAFGAMIAGAAVAISAIFAQKLWVPSLYPWIAAHGWAPALDSLLRTLSAPMEPWVHWELTPDKFPISSVEVGVANYLFTILLYIAISLATCRKPFDLDRLLHRDCQTSRDGRGDAGTEKETDMQLPMPKRRHAALNRLVGIDGDYTRGDKALAWSVFLYSFAWCFGLCFIGNIAWHVLGTRGILPPQPDSWWGTYFFIVNICVACAIGIVSTIWFGICSVRDLLRLFRDLDERERLGGVPDDLDDGRVVETTRN